MSVKKHIFFFFVFQIISLVLYANTLQNQFVYDDYQFVGRPGFNQLDMIPKLLFMPGDPRNEVSGFRPLTYMTMSAQLTFAGNHPLTFHIFNIVVNGLNGFLVFELIFILFSNPLLALFTAVLFSVFPIHTENVAYIKARDDLLSAFFLLIASCCYFSSFKYYKRVVLKRVLAGLFFAFSLLSKELLLLAPIGLMLGAYFRFNKKLKSVFFSGLPFLIALVLYIGLRFAVFGHSAFSGEKETFLFNPLTNMMVIPKTLTNFKLVWMYIYKTLVPIRLSAGYQFNEIKIVYNPFDSIETLLGIDTTIAVAILLAIKKTRESLIGVALAIFLFSFITLPKFLFNAADIFAERWMYIPSLGIAMLLGWGFYLLYKRSKSIAVGLFLGLILIYSLRTITRNLVWRTPLSFAQNMAIDAPDSMQSHYLVALEWAKLGNFGDAARSAARAYQIYKLDQPLLTFMGGLAYHQQRYDLAQELFLQAVKLVPIQKEPRVYYAFTSLRLKQYPQAIEIIMPVYKQFPNDGEVKAILGTAYYRLGLMEEAKKLIPYDEKTKKFEIQDEMDKF